MSIEEFKSELIDTINNTCMENEIPIKAFIRKIWKVNTFDEKLSFTTPEELTTAPSISIGDIYLEYCKAHQNMNTIIQKILETFLWYCENDAYKDLSKQNLTNMQTYIDKIAETGNLIPVLINTKANENFISELVHRQWLDLTIVYQLSLKRDETSAMTIFVTNGILKHINLSENDLYEKAMKNLEISTMLAHTTDLPSKANNRRDNEMIAISARGEYGAAGILNHKAIRFLAENYGDMYLLPASIDMFYAIKTDMDIPENLLESVYEINQTIKPTERLSNNIYKLHADGLRVELIRSEYKDLL